MQYLYRPTSPEYAVAAEKVYAFLRRHAPAHYSTQTMMAFARQTGDGTAPLLAIDSVQEQVDRLTEVKQGGLRSAAAVLRDGRAILCTHSEHRRNGHGAAMLHQLMTNTNREEQLQFWVAPTNADAIRFLTAQGLIHIASNATAQCWGLQGRVWPL